MSALVKYNMKKISLPAIVCLILALAMVLSLVQPAYAAAPPAIPQQFYGTVTINGTSASAGAAVSAKVGGTQLASTTTDSQGRYGYSPIFTVAASSGATMDFYINGVKAQQSFVFNSGAVTRLDLIASGTPPPPPPPQSVTITATILGLIGSFNISQAGVLSTATTLSSSDGKVQLSLNVNTTVNIQGQALTVAAELAPPAAPANSSLVSGYNFAPNNTTFSPAASLTLKYDPATLPSGVTESNLYIAFWTGSAWSELTSTVNTQNKTVTAPVSHFTVFAILGRTGTTTPSPTPQPPTPQPPATPVTISTTVLGSAGSFSVGSGGVLSSDTTLSSSDGRVQLSLNANTTVTIQGQSLTVTAESAPPTLPANVKLVNAYNFGPSNTTFNPAVNLSLKYDPANLPQGLTESNLYIAYWDGSAWAPLTSTVNTQNKTISTQVAHFTIFAVLGRTAQAAPPSPASFAASGLNVSPTSVNPGGQVIIAAEVSNSGGSEGSYTVVLKINGVSEAEKQVTLSPGKTQGVTFTINKQTPGSYSVSIAGQSASFTVNSPPPPAEAPKISLPLPLIAIGAAVILLIIIIVLALRRRAY